MESNLWSLRLERLTKTGFQLILPPHDLRDVLDEGRRKEDRLAGLQANISFARDGCNWRTGRVDSLRRVEVNQQENGHSPSRERNWREEKESDDTERRNA